MSHEVKDDIDGEGVGARFGEEVKIELVLAFTFPAIAGIGIMGGNDHNPFLVIEPRSYMHLLRTFAAVD